jgi:hypothetical protein
MYFDLSIPSQLAGALLPDLILVIGAMLLLLVAVWGKESLSHARLTGLLSIAVCAISFAAIVWLWRARRVQAPGSSRSTASGGLRIASCLQRRSSPPRS